VVVAALQLFAAMALVGSYVALVKPLTALFPLFALAFLRFLIAALALMPWTWRRASEPPLVPAESRGLFLQSFFGNFLFSICMLSGVSMMPAAAAGIVMSTLPVVVALFSWAMLGEPLSRRLLLAVASAAGGIWLLQAGAAPGAGAGGRWLGAILVMAAVCCEALYVVIGKRLVASRSPMRITAWINLWGLVLTAPLGLWQMWHFDLRSIGAPAWAVLGFYSIGSSVVAVWLWMSGLRRVPASYAGIFTVALPLAATAVAVAWLGEPAGWRHALALALSVLAIWLTVSRAPLGLR
jgi:drug/metabolite transporter (DMT)-like permease